MVAIGLPLPLESLGPTSRILLSCLHESESWSEAGSAFSLILQPPTRDGEHGALQEGRTYLLATTQLILLVCPESRSARGGQTSEILWAVPPLQSLPP